MTRERTRDNVKCHLCVGRARGTRARARAQRRHRFRAIDKGPPRTARALWTARTSTLSLACELPKNPRYLQPRSLSCCIVGARRRFDYPREAREDAFPPPVVSPRCQSCQSSRSATGDATENESENVSMYLVTRARMSERAKCMTRRESVTELKRHAPVTSVRWPWNIDPIQRDKEGEGWEEMVKAMKERRRGTCFPESRSARRAPCQGYAPFVRIVLWSRGYWMHALPSRFALT